MADPTTTTELYIQTFGTPEEKAAAGLSPGPLTLAPMPGAGPTVLGTPNGQVASPDQPMATPPPSMADRFRAAVNAGVPQPLKDFDQAFRQAQADHPALNWGVNVAPKALAGGVMGPAAGAVANAPAALAPNAQPFPSGVAASRGEAAGAGIAAGTNVPPPAPPTRPSVPVASLPNAPPKPVMFGGTGPGGGAGLGSDKALQGAQNDVTSGQQALVDKATETAGAKLKALDYEADAKSAAAAAQRIFAEHQKAVDEGIVKEQSDYEQKMADERDKAAKLGIDPGRVFKNRSTGTWVLMSIGALAGGALSGLKGTPNSFIETLRGVVHDDIDAQDKDIQQAWKKVGGMQTTYENLVRRGVDKRAAQNAYLGQVLDSIKGELQARIQKAQLPAEKANYEAAIQSLENERSAMDVRMQEYWKQIYDRRSAAAASAAAAAAERLFQHSAKLYELQTGRISAEKTNANSEGNATLHEQLRSYSAALDGLDRMQQMIAAGGKLDPARTAEGESLVAATANALARAETGGKRPPSEAEMSLLHKQLPADPNHYQWTEADLARIRTTRLKVIRDMNRVRADAGLAPVPEEEPKGVGSVPGAKPVQ